MFVSKERVPISDDQGNTIYIRPKMDYGTRNKVLGAGVNGDGHVDLGTWQNSLLIHNIIDWEGPAFTGVACTHENILSLDPDEPLVEKVLDEIGKRNPQKEPGEKKGSTSTGEHALIANGKSPRGRGRPISH